MSKANFFDLNYLTKSLIEKGLLKRHRREIISSEMNKVSSKNIIVRKKRLCFRTKRVCILGQNLFVL
jgi:hypothetical protein